MNRRIPFFSKLYKILKKSFIRFFENQTVLISSGLALKTVTALLPLVILITEAVKLFLPSYGIKEKIINFLKDFILPSTLDNVANWISNAFSSSGKISLLSVIILLYLALDLFMTLDMHIEKIWISNSNKRLSEKALKYWMLLTTAPFILVGYFYYSGFIKTVLDLFPLKDITYLQNLIYNFISFCLLVIFIFIIYYIIPSAKVNFFKALCTSISVVLVCYVLKIFFVYYSKIFLSGSHFIYGAFATVIIFIFWTSLNWMALLFGEEFLYVWQNKLYHENIRFGKTFLFDIGYTLLILKEIYKDFKNKSKGITLKKISERLSFDMHSVKRVLNILETENLILNDNKPEPRYYIKQNIGKIKLNEIEVLVWKKIIPVEYQNYPEIKRICIALGKNYINEKNSTKINIVRFLN